MRRKERALASAPIISSAEMKRIERVRSLYYSLQEEKSALDGYYNGAVEGMAVKTLLEASGDVFYRLFIAVYGKLQLLEEALRDYINIEVPYTRARTRVDGLAMIHNYIRNIQENMAQLIPHVVSIDPKLYPVCAVLGKTISTLPQPKLRK